MIHFDMPREKSNIIKVLGFGGGGGNAVNHMFLQQIQNVDFVICNTDAQALQHSPVPNKIQLGPHLTQGLGAGANPQIGKQATEESLEEIRRILEINTKMAFITAGMGGGTGTGGAPTVARICRELGILTVGIVTTPFQFEGPRRMAQARQGIDELKEHVDTLLVISNDKLRNQFGSLKMKEAFSKADDVLTTAARCITDVINTTGQINVDFADVCTVMRNGGVAILGNGVASGENRAMRAIEAAANSPLLNDNDISGAKWILLNISSAEGEHEYTMEEVEIIQEYVRRQTGDNADVILGMGYDETLGENIGITLIATGFRHKDPFEKATVKKVEVKPEPQEPQIFMTLGVEGEEKKMEMPVFSDPVVETLAANPAPLVVEMPAPQEATEVFMLDASSPINSSIIEEELPMDEQHEALSEATLDARPVVYELSCDTIADPEPPAEAVAFIEEEEEDSPVEMASQEETEEEQVAIPTFLSKPSQIYFEAPRKAEIKPADEEEEDLAPVMQEHPEMKEELQEELKPLITEEWNEEDAAVAGISMTMEEQTAVPEKQPTLFSNTAADEDLSEDEEQKRRAKERINRLRNLSFNPQNLDQNSEFEQVPAYLRRDMNLHNSIANVEDFYSRAQVKTDENNQGQISTLNNFLHGEKPD